MPRASSCERAAEPATSVAQRTVEVCGYRHCLRLRWWGKGGIRPGRAVLLGRKRRARAYGRRGTTSRIYPPWPYQDNVAEREGPNRPRRSIR